MAKIQVNLSEITVVSFQGNDYISLTDMANAKDGDERAADIIKNWIRTRYTLAFLGTLGQIHNPNFKVVEFDHFNPESAIGFCNEGSKRKKISYLCEEESFTIMVTSNRRVKLLIWKRLDHGIERLLHDTGLKNRKSIEFRKCMAKV